MMPTIKDSKGWGGTWGRRAFEVVLVSGLLGCLGACAGTADGVAAEGEATDSQDLVGTNVLSGPERTQFMDAARGKFFGIVQRSSPVAFVVRQLKIAPGERGVPYAYMEARPIIPNTDQDYDYRGTPIQAVIDAGLFDGNVAHVVQKKVNGTWRNLDMWIGPTDIAWAGMPCSDGAPPEIFGMPPQDCRDYLGWKNIFVFEPGVGSFDTVDTRSRALVTFKSERPLVFDLQFDELGVISHDPEVTRPFRVDARDLVAVPKDGSPDFDDEATFERGDCKLVFTKTVVDGSDTDPNAKEILLDLRQVGPCTSLGLPRTQGIDLLTRTFIHK